MAMPAMDDSFLAGDTITAIKTNEVSMDFESQTDGAMARLLVSAGDMNIFIGANMMTTITVMDTSEVGTDPIAAQRNMGGRPKGSSNANKQKMELKQNQVIN